ncbi:(2Fe-2S)-binding protein [Streptomyces sp. SP17BM10]|uniref:(2Fe-2S)-binding protein n=1 Tax=Streptomyces sp. SP17BM10 TaxID=3002530 RepID=UPI002E79B5A5|nr:(2Fe-2S)-binding protein [Streptomyces sp. SP17BM10]MEE1787501.1 (2Fe-2S)-binding protein [Streptomyces sp. SP17BM10]
MPAASPASPASPVPSVPLASPARVPAPESAARPALALLADYRRLCDLCPALDLRVLGPADPDPSATDGWYSGAQLARDEEALAAALAGEQARIVELHGRAPRPHVTASRLLHHYVWSACLLIAGPWHLARRVPAVDAADLWLHAPTGNLALRPRGHAGRPGGPTGEDELRAELRAAVVAHAEPLVAAFAGPTRRRDRALWGMVTDDLASAIWYLGRMLDEEEAAVTAAGAVLPGGTLPLPGAADFRHLPTPDGRCHPTRTRLGCCLYYAVAPDAVACLTCPRTSDEERVSRL